MRDKIVERAERVLDLFQMLGQASKLFLFALRLKQTFKELEPISNTNPLRS
jgi:hypothetical protein